MKKATIYIFAVLLTAALFTGCAETVNPAPGNRMVPRTRAVPDGSRINTAPSEQIVTPRIVPPNRGSIVSDKTTARDGIRRNKVTRDDVQREGMNQAIPDRVIIDGVARDGIVRYGDVPDGVVRDGIRRDGIVRDGIARSNVRTHQDGFMVDGVHSRTLTR